MENSAFQTLGGDTLDKVLLEEEEEGQHRDKGGSGHGKCCAVVRHRAVVEHLQSVGNGVSGGLVQVEQRTHEIFPAAHEGQHADSDEGGHNHRDDDAEENAVPAAAVDLGGLVHIAGDAADELHDEEDVEAAGKERRYDHRQIAADPAYFVEQDKAGDHHDLAGQHHRNDHQHEPDVAALEADARQTKGDERRGNRHADGGKNGDEQRVLEEHREGVAAKTLPALDVVFQRGLGRDKGGGGGKDITVGLEGRGNQPQHRVEHQEADKQHQHMVDGGTDRTPARHAGGNVFHQHSQLPSFRFVVDPRAGGAEDQSREEGDDQQHEPCHGAAVAHLKLVEGLVVQVDTVVQGRVQRLAAGDEVAGVERLKRADDLVDEVEEDDGGQHRQRDGEEAAHRAGTVHDGGLVVTLGNVLDGGQKNQHRGAELPHAQGNQGAQRGLGVAQPGGAVRQTEEAQHLVDNAPGGEQLLPQQGDGNAAAHQGGNVERGAVEAGQSGRAGQHQRDEQCDRQLDGHLDQCKLESDFEGRPEQIILQEHLLEVVKAHPLGGGQDVVVGEGQV